MRRDTLKNGKLHTEDILKHTQRICNRIHHNLLEIKNLSADLLHLYKVLRYEDLVLDLENTTRNLFKFAKIPMRMEISDWIKINTKASSVPYPRKPYSPYSTHRNASTLVDNWKRELSGSDKLIIERYCMSVMKILGYLPSKETREFVRYPTSWFCLGSVESRNMTSQKLKFVKLGVGCRILRKKKIKKDPLPKISLLVKISGDI